MFRKIFSYLLIFLLVFSLVNFQLATVSASDLPKIWVSNTGDDLKDGLSEANAVLTMQKALSLASSYSAAQIVLTEGDYITPAISIYHPNLTISSYYNPMENEYDKVTLYADYSYTGGKLLGMWTNKWIFDFRNNLGTIKIQHLNFSGDNLETSTIEDGSDVTGVHIYSIDTGGANISIEACTFKNMYSGLQEEYSDDLDIELKNNNISAIVPLIIESEKTSTVLIDSNNITKTNAENYGSVIKLDYTRTSTQIVNNTIDGGLTKKGQGIYGDFTYGKIENNQFINLTDGIELDEVINLNITNNVFNLSKGDAIEVETYDDILGNIAINSNIINSINETGSIAIKFYIDRDDAVGNGNYSVTNNTISNFNRAIYLYNDNDEYPENLVVGGSEGNENKFRGNITNFYCEYASTILPFNLTHNDWGTENEEIILSKINLRNHNSETKTDYIQLDSTFSTNAPTEVWVDDDFSETNCDSHTFGLDAFKSISEGKSHVKIGGIVNVADGIYDEQVFIFDSVSLVGSGEDTILKNTYGKTVIPIIADTVKIEGMNITEGEYGIFVSNSSYINSYLNNSIYNIANIGPPVNISLKGNFFTNQTPPYEYGAGFGIYIDDYLSNNSINNIEVYGNKFTNDNLKSSWAIYLSSNLKISNSIIKNNEIIKGYRNGLCLYSNGTTLIQNNIFHLDEANYGISLYSYGNATIKNNTIISKVDSIGFWSDNYGLRLDANGLNAEPENNKHIIENNTISGFNTGILVGNYDIIYPPEVIVGGESSKYNDLSNNKIALCNASTNITINATYNTWGVEDSLIPSLIYDSNDASYYGPVIYLPSKNPVSTNANLSALAAMGIELSPAFNSDIASYSGNVDYTLERTTISAISADNNATIKINNTETSYKGINLNIGNNLISVDVTAEDGITSKSYSINIKRDAEPINPTVAKLSILTASGITLNPTFSGDITNYSATVSYNVDRTTISAITLENGATVKINDTLSSTKEIYLNIGSNIISVEVTAVDGITKNTYTITINRETESTNGGNSSSGNKNSYTPPLIKVTTEKSDYSVTNSSETKASVSLRTAKASLTSALIDALLEKANSSNGKDINDIIEIGVKYSGNINKVEVDLAYDELEKISKNTNSKFRIKSQMIDITFDGKAIDEISKRADRENIVISASIIDPSKLSERDKKKVDGRPVYDLTIMAGKTLISDFNKGHATVSIPYVLKQNENPNAIVIYYLSDDGNLKLVRGSYDKLTKRVIFETTHFSNFVIGYNLVTFDDVSENAWYKNAVDFIASRKIANGTGYNIYNPDANLKRGEFIVLLMNAYQISPDRKVEFNIVPFDDAGNTYYTDYLYVAKGLRISNGIGNNLFSPEKEITRQEMFVMIYNVLDKLEELPDYTYDKQLEDFDDSNIVAPWAKESISALLKTGIISGNNNRLNPTQNTTRAEIAQVIYNILSK